MTSNDLGLINDSLETQEGTQPGKGKGPYNKGAIKKDEIERVKAALGQGQMREAKSALQPLL